MNETAVVRVACYLNQQAQKEEIIGGRPGTKRREIEINLPEELIREDWVYIDPNGKITIKGGLPIKSVVVFATSCSPWELSEAEAAEAVANGQSVTARVSEKSLDIILSGWLAVPSPEDVIERLLAHRLAVVQAAVNAKNRELAVATAEAAEIQRRALTEKLLQLAESGQLYTRNSRGQIEKLEKNK